MEMPEQSTPQYSPLAILNLFNNAIAVGQSKRLIQLKGVFIPRSGAAYSGYYYDSLRDESADALLTIIVPALIRNNLQANKAITVNGFITRRVVNNASRIDVQFTVTDLIEQTQSKYTEEDTQRISILQKKADAGFRDLGGYIKEKIGREEHFRIGVIIGRSAIIDQDIKHQLRESIGFYDLFFHKISLTNDQEIIQAMATLDQQGVDVIVISRGGGENLDIFNQTSIAETAINLNALFITAIGHKQDVTLLQQVADKAFITPSEFGQFLNDIYNHTMEDIQHSKAKLVDAVTKQLSANYDQQINNLNQQIKEGERLKQEELNILKNQIEATKKINKVFIAVSLLIGLLIGIILYSLVKH
jgi:exodeoxyribonuclease VII large subunit